MYEGLYIFFFVQTKKKIVCNNFIFGGSRLIVVGGVFRLQIESIQSIQSFRVGRPAGFRLR